MADAPHIGLPRRAHRRTALSIRQTHLLYGTGLNHAWHIDSDHPLTISAQQFSHGVFHCAYDPVRQSPLRCAENELGDASRLHKRQEDKPRFHINCAANTYADSSSLPQGLRIPSMPYPRYVTPNVMVGYISHMVFIFPKCIDFNLRRALWQLVHHRLSRSAADYQIRCERLVMDPIHIYRFHRTIFIRPREAAGQAAFPGYTTTCRIEIQKRYRHIRSPVDHGFNKGVGNILKGSCIGSAGFDLMEGVKLHKVACLHFLPVRRRSRLLHTYM